MSHNPQDNGKKLKTDIPTFNAFVEEHSLSMDEIPDVLYYLDYSLAAKKSHYKKLSGSSIDQSDALQIPPTIDDLIVLHMKDHSEWPAATEDRISLPPISKSGLVSLYTDKELLLQQIEKLRSRHKFVARKIVRSRLLSRALYRVARDTGIKGLPPKLDLIMFSVEEMIDAGLVEKHKYPFMPAEGHYLLWGMAQVGEW